MKIRVLGCYGGRLLDWHLTSFLVNESILLDAGSPTITLSLEEQFRIRHVFISHTHLDHINDVAFLADNRSIKLMREGQGDNNILVHSLPENIHTLSEDFLNDRIWPDFTRIPLQGRSILSMRAFQPEEVVEADGVRIMPILVNHPVPCTAFLLDQDGRQFLYSADTGITERMWEIANAQSDLRGVILDCSFPNEYAKLARISGHLTPEQMASELRKLKRLGEIPIYLFHMKPETIDAMLPQIEEQNIPGLRILEQGQIIEV